MGRLVEIVLADFFHLIGCIFAIIVGPSVPPHEETIISNSSKRSGASEPLIVTLMSWTRTQDPKNQTQTSDVTGLGAYLYSLFKIGLVEHRN
jgi:hypothetical protein